MAADSKHQNHPNDTASNNRDRNLLEFTRYYLQSVTNPKTEGFVAIRSTADETEPKVASNSPAKLLNSLDYNIYELSKWYVMKFREEDGTSFEFSVVVNMKDRDVVDSKDPKGMRLMGIKKGGILMHWKVGNEEWDLVSVTNDVTGVASRFVDVLYRVAKGLFCAVDDRGNVAIIDEDLKVEVVKWPIVVDWAVKDLEKKFLLESGGSLYLVVERLNCVSGKEFGRAYVSGEAEDLRIKVFRLDDAQKKWKRVRKLGDRVFFVGHLMSSSVEDATVYPLLGKNCVFFGATGSGDSAGQQVLCVFDIATGFWGELSNSHGTKTGMLVSLPAPC